VHSHGLQIVLRRDGRHAGLRGGPQPPSELTDPLLEEERFELSVPAALANSVGTTFHSIPGGYDHR
jgi:hypothetical protein